MFLPDAKCAHEHGLEVFRLESVNRLTLRVTHGPPLDGLI